MAVAEFVMDQPAARQVDHTDVCKDRAFAAGASRNDIEAATADFGVDVWEHVGNVIQAMRKIAPELGLAGDSA